MVLSYKTGPDPVQVYVDLGAPAPGASAILTQEIKRAVYQQLSSRFATNILYRDNEGLWCHIPRFPIDFSFPIGKFMIDFARASNGHRYSTSFSRGNWAIDRPEPLLSDYRDEVIADTVTLFADSGAVQLTNTPSSLGRAPL